MRLSGVLRAISVAILRVQRASSVLSEPVGVIIIGVCGVVVGVIVVGVGIVVFGAALLIAVFGTAP